MKNNKRNTLVLIVSVVGVLCLTVGVSIAFFNYTRTGTANTVSTGRVAFSSSQDGRINLTNIFPINPEENGIMNDSTKVGSVAITVTGDTTYDNGVEYLISATNVNNTVNNKEIPISVSATTSGTLGTEDEDYFDNRDTATSHIYKVLARDTISNNDQLMVGYIAKNATGINGTITIKAYIDKNNIAISDTYNSNGTPTDTNGTTSEWVDGRMVFTTTEWNSLQGTGVSFQVRVEANEGIWVEEIETVNTMNTFPSTISSQKSNIKEIYFNKMSASAMQTAYNNATIKADLTYNNEGKVLAWLEPDTTDNTKYIMYVASNGKTYLTTGAGLINTYTSLEKIEFNNIDTTRVTSMDSMFTNDTNLSSLYFGDFNMINVTSSRGMFANTGITTLDLSNLNATNLTAMDSMFSGSTNLTTLNLSGVGGNNLNSVLNTQLFQGCNNLITINMSGFNFGHVTNIDGLFSNHGSIETIDLSNVVNFSNITSTNGLFYNCSNLETIYVSNDWSNANITSSTQMFGGCSSLKGGGTPQTTYDANHIDKEYARIDGGANSSTPGYLTLKTN